MLHFHNPHCLSIKCVLLQSSSKQELRRPSLSILERGREDRSRKCSSVLSGKHTWTCQESECRDRWVLQSTFSRTRTRSSENTKLARSLIQFTLWTSIMCKECNYCKKNQRARDYIFCASICRLSLQNARREKWDAVTDQYNTNANRLSSTFVKFGSPKKPWIISEFLYC